MQGPENSVTSGEKAGNTPTKDGLHVAYNGPNEHIELLEFYFGHPTSTVKW